MTDEKMNIGLDNADPDEELTGKVQRLNLHPVHPKVSFQMNRDDSISEQDDCKSDSVYSEYSDSDDIPPIRKGRKVWEYFFILKKDFDKGLNNVWLIFKKETKMWGEMYQRFERRSNTSFRFHSSRYYSLLINEQLIRVQGKYIRSKYPNKKKACVVKLMNVEAILSN